MRGEVHFGKSLHALLELVQNGCQRHSRPETTTFEIETGSRGNTTLLGNEVSAWAAEA